MNSHDKVPVTGPKGNLRSGRVAGQVEDQRDSTSLFRGPCVLDDHVFGCSSRTECFILYRHVAYYLSMKVHFHGICRVLSVTKASCLSIIFTVAEAKQVGIECASLNTRKAS